MGITAVCLMGATATGKTDVAVRLCEQFAFEVISVDSALVYRGMDIGTAKPDAVTLARVPHRLIDIRDPEEPYSAGDFVRDARAAITEVAAAGRVPLLVGGTMMYFRALTRGIAELPGADPAVREAIDRDAAEQGWPALHARLQAVDPESAARINPNDSQRIQRALEVYVTSGKSLTDWHSEGQAGTAGGSIRFLKLGLELPDRAVLHRRIEQRLDAMLGGGFLGEVTGLMQRPGLTPDMPSMRAVGYRQIWAHLAGELTLAEGRYRALVATRQLAKRQITWLRSEAGLTVYDPLEADCIDRISKFLADSGLIE